MSTIDEGERDKVLQQTTEIAMGELALIPLHHQVNLWASRKRALWRPLRRTHVRLLVLDGAALRHGWNRAIPQARFQIAFTKLAY